MIGRTWKGLSLVAVGAALTGCPQKAAPVADAAPSATVSASATASAAPAPLAANEGDIKRYPGAETKLDKVPQKIEAYVATVRSDASSGASLVAVLKKGTDTSKIAQKDTFYLITFTDPGSPGRTVMGWVDQKAYTAVTWDAGKHVVCQAGQATIILDVGEQCVVPCDPNNDNCPANQVCNGDAPRSNKGVPGDNVEFCVVGVKKSPTPTPTPTDAGTTPPATTDAGTTTPDAAAPVAEAGAPKSAKPPMLPKPDGGRCPAGYDETRQRCQLHCATDADCNNLPGWHCSKQSSCSDLPGT